MDEILEQTKLNVSIEEPTVHPPPPHTPKKRTETLLNWFDRNCEKELKKHRAQMSVSLDTGTANMSQLNVSKSSEPSHHGLLNSTVSGIDIACRLRGEQDTDLMEAIEKLAKAEAMVAFEGAVRAAEEAATNAPPEYAEEAAAASARSFQAELTEVVKEVVPGTRPVEVVGYIGITRPKKPMKTNS